MYFLQKLGRALAASLLTTVLFALGTVWSLHALLGTPDHIKQALRDSGIYHSVVGAALEQAQKGSTDQPGQQEQPGSSGDKTDIPVNSADVRQVIEAAFPPSYLQDQTEGVIDDVYAWMQGKTPTLQFSVNLTDAKMRLATGMQQYVQQRLTALPVCSTPPVPGQDVDPFSATCVPRGFDIAATAAKAHDQIAGGEFLKDSNLTADSIKVGDGNKTLAQQLHGVPQYYSHIGQGIMGLMVVAVLLGGLVVLLSRPWWKGLRRLSWILLWVGGVSVVTSVGAGYALRRAGAELNKNPDFHGTLQHKVLDAVQLLVGSFRVRWMAYGIVLLSLAVITLVTLHFVKPKNKQDDATGKGKSATPSETDGQPTTPSATRQGDSLLDDGNEAAPSAKPRQRPSKRLVQ